MMANTPSPQALNQKLQNVLYELNQIKGAMTNVVKPRGKYRKKMEQAFHQDLKRLASIAHTSHIEGFRLDPGYRQIRNLMEYYQQQGKVWFPTTIKKKTMPNPKPRPTLF